MRDPIWNSSPPAETPADLPPAICDERGVCGRCGALTMPAAGVGDARLSGLPCPECLVWYGTTSAEVTPPWSDTAATLAEMEVAIAAVHAAMPDRIGPWFLNEAGELRFDGDLETACSDWDGHREAIRALSRHPRARFKFWSDGTILVDTTPKPIEFKVASVASAEAFPIGAYLHNYATTLPKGLRIIDDPPPESAVNLPARPSVELGPNRKERRKAAALARGARR